MDLDETDNKFKIWAMLCHLTAFISFGIPFGNFIGAISLWLFKRKDSEFVNQNAKEAINFQLLCALVAVVCSFSWSFGVGFIIALFFGIYAVFEIVLAITRASQGKVHKYKYSIRLLK